MMDVHPDALACGRAVVQNILTNPNLKVEADGRDLWQKEPKVTLEVDSSDFQSGITFPHHHANDLWNFVDPDLAEGKDEMARAKKMLDAKKAKEKRNSEGGQSAETTSKKSRAKKKSKVVVDEVEYPPQPGQMMEFWGGECFYVGTFLKMEVDFEGDEVCHIADCEDEKEVHQIVLREPDGSDSTDWDPLFMCHSCDEYTYGESWCRGCKVAKDEIDTTALDGDYS